ncbi:MAG: DUF2513 domain-containing protein [Desulfuromonadales bacterium]
MTRDWQLIKTILIKLEALESTRAMLRPDAVTGYDSETVSYHIRLLMQSGMIDGSCNATLNEPLYCYGRTLTWEGHEFLDTIRSDTSWNRITKTAREKGLDLSFGIIKAIAEGVTKALVTI